MSLMSCDFMRREVKGGESLANSHNHVLFDWKISTKMRCCHQSSRLNGSDICKANGKCWDHCELLFFWNSELCNQFVSVFLYKCQKNNDKCPYKSLLVLSSSCSCRLKLESIYNNNTELSTELNLSCLLSVEKGTRLKCPQLCWLLSEAKGALS